MVLGELCAPRRATTGQLINNILSPFHTRAQTIWQTPSDKILWPDKREKEKEERLRILYPEDLIYARRSGDQLSALPPSSPANLDLLLQRPRSLDFLKCVSEGTMLLLMVPLFYSSTLPLSQRSKHSKKSKLSAPTSVFYVHKTFSFVSASQPAYLLCAFLLLLG